MTISVRIGVAVLLVCGIASAAPGGPAFEGGDGTTCDKAIVIKGAASEFEGVASEYRYLSERHPGWSLKEQSLLRSGDRSFDLLKFTTADGRERRACFDISEFYRP